MTHLKTAKPSNRCKVLLVGGGHGHLELLRQTARLRAAGLDLHLIDPGRFIYSGMASGVVERTYHRQDASVDLRALAAHYEIGYSSARLQAIDRAAKTVMLSDQSATRRYDLISLNIGSEVAVPSHWTTHKRVAAKPLQALTLLGANHAVDGKVLVVGGGHSAVEIAAALATRQAVRRVQVVSASQAFDPHPRIDRKLKSWLRRRQVEVTLQRRIETLVDGIATDEAGQQYAFDLAVIATGLRPNRLIKSLGLPYSAAGLSVNHALQSTTDPAVFAVGDCADIGAQSLPKVGVFGVRAAPILAHNLVAQWHGEPLRAFKPQRRWLAIINVGNRHALACWNGWSFGGHLAWRWKRHLDQGFIRRHQVGSPFDTYL